MSISHGLMEGSTTSRNWTNILFFTLTPLVGVIGTIWSAEAGGIPWPTWGLSLFMTYATGMSITSGYHRLYSHKSYQASWPLRLIFLLFGAAAFQNSARWWCSEHRYHHRFVDTERDPYGINKGFWYAHIGWLTARRDAELGYSNIGDLERDRLLLWQDRYYYPIATVICFGFPTAMGALWGDPWGGLFLAGFVRLVCVHHLTWLINSAAHTFGRQTYSDQHSGRDNWFAALFTFGEGYHNFHHEFPSDYRNGLRPFHWDPTKWLIRAFSWMGLARGLKRVDRQRILAARWEMEQKRLIRHWESSGIRNLICVRLEKARQKLQQTHEHFLNLKGEYHRLKKERINQVSDQLTRLRLEVRRSRYEFRLALAFWKAVIKGKLSPELLPI